MNDIITTVGGSLTMSSLEIAGLTGKRHDNIVRDVRKMATDLGLSLTFEEKSAGNGRPLVIVNLPKRETLILVSGYSVEMRARIIDRWMELERAVTAGAPASNVSVAELTAEVRKVVGGIMKGVVHNELTNVIPDLIRSELASQSYYLRRGKTAGQIWRDHGFPRIRVTCWFSNRLVKMGCQIEGGGRGELGAGTAKLFDPDKANVWMRNGGKALVQEYVNERQGQRRLRLVQTAPNLGGSPAH